jgi:GH15 family glucan-1,4-alpha-glucosidase
VVGHGVHRRLGDEFYGGGLWLLLAGLLGWHYSRSGRVDDARAELEWIAAQASEEGDLPEQVDRHLLRPEKRDEWVERWGPPACPLLWSHALFLTLALELGALSMENAA